MAIPLTWAQVHAWRLAAGYISSPAPAERWSDVVRAVGGLQAQVMSSAELALGLRVGGITPATVQQALWQDRRLVKLWAMRGTLHLIGTEDLPLYIAALSTSKRHHSPAWLKYFNLTADEADLVLDTLAEVVDAQPRTRSELADAIVERTGNAVLGEEMRSGWGTLLKPAAYNGVLIFGPNRGQSVTFVSPAKWVELGPIPDSATAFAEILRRYLRAYGPSSREEFARWWGMDGKRARPIFSALADELVEVDIEGHRALALDDTVPQILDTAPAAGVRLLGGFDPYTIALLPQSHAWIPDGYKPRVSRTAGWISPLVLDAGCAVGMWQPEKRRGGLTLRVEWFVPPTAKVLAGVQEAAERIATFLGQEVAVA